MLLQILAACPMPGPPQWTMRLPIASRIGFALSNASGEPPHIKVSVPAVAPPTPPDTGASSVSAPASAPASWARLALSTSMVEQSITRAFCGAAGKKSHPAREHVPSGGQHGHGRVRFRDGLACALSDRHTGGGGGLLLRLDEVEAYDRMTRLDEIGGHWQAHVAQTQKCDFGHQSPQRGLLKRPNTTSSR